MYAWSGLKSMETVFLHASAFYKFTNLPLKTIHVLANQLRMSLDAGCSMSDTWKNTESKKETRNVEKTEKKKNL